MFAGALAALALGLVLARSATYGPALTNDTVMYMVVADSLLAGDGFTAWQSSRGAEPYVKWPPFLPLVLAAADLLGLELLSRSHWLHAAVFALAVFLVGGYAAPSRYGRRARSVPSGRRSPGPTRWKYIRCAACRRKSMTHPGIRRWNLGAPLSSRMARWLTVSPLSSTWYGAASSRPPGRAGSRTTVRTRGNSRPTQWTA